MESLDILAAKAVKQFWKTRGTQETRQARSGGKKDVGGRSAVTGGAQLDGFAKLVWSILVENGIDDANIFRKRDVTLPGFFRPTKEWDLLVVIKSTLLATIEFKSQIGPSFGNNFNNRTEEAIGSATDLWTAYREGAFKISQRPWLGYFFLLEDTTKSRTPVKVKEPHFPVFPEFQGASYAQRYEMFCRKLVRERLYDSACFILTNREQGLARGAFIEPAQELSFVRFAESLTAKAISFVKYNR